MLNHDQAVFVGLALFNLRSGWDQLPENVRLACASAIRARVDLVMQMTATPAPIPASFSLISGASVLDVLARRAMNDGAWKKALEMSPPFWYGEYCINLFELAEVAQRSVVGGRLKLRSTSTRVELTLDALSFWINTDLAAKHREGLELLADCADWDAACQAWPDRWMALPGAVLLSEADEWAVSEGITQPGELARLLGLSEPAAQTGADVVPLQLVRSDSRSNDTDACSTASKLDDVGIAAKHAELTTEGCKITSYADLKKFRGATTGAKWNDDMKVVLAEEKKARCNRVGANGVSKQMANDLKVSVQVINKKVAEGNSIIKKRNAEQLATTRHKA